jgi:hypothetical protein
MERKGEGYQEGRGLITEPTTLIVVHTSAVLPIRGGKEPALSSFYPQQFCAD